MLDIILKKFREKNPTIPVFSVYDSEFLPFGRIIEGVDTTEILEVAKSIPMPKSGSRYLPSEPSFEALPIAKEIEDKFYGTLPAQCGYCWGYNSKMDATEWHTSSEINIPTTPIILILGHLWDVKDGKIDSGSFKAFYAPKGIVLEVYGTSLHYCACQTSDEGFGCVVGLPKDTNTPLSLPVDSKFLFRRNKWIIACLDNEALINDGVFPGISGENYEIKY